MNAPRFAKLSASLLAQNSRLQTPEADSIAPPPPIDIENRARAISAIERAIREKARRKNRIRWIAGGLAMAASIAAIVTANVVTKSLTHTQAPVAVNAPANDISLALAHATGDVSVASQSGTTAGTDGANLAAGTHVVTKSGGHAVLALSTGTRLAVDESSDFSVVEEDATQIFALSQGSMRADVAKLKPGQRFIIRTSDSEVEVHGTSFTVSVVPAAAPADPRCGTVTRVVVFEGVVTVRHDGVEARVPKGSSWPADCAGVTGANDSNSSATAGGTAVLELPNDSNTSSDDRSNDDKTPPSTNAHEKSHPAHHTKKTSSPLSEQNDIFESGLTAERDGLVAGAISDYERYLSLYPNGPLAEHATVRRMNLLRTVDPPRAVTAAKDYLARYPNGFARGDAEAIATEKR